VAANSAEQKRAVILFIGIPPEKAESVILDDSIAKSGGRRRTS